MTAVAEQLHGFAAALLERRGAAVDWPPGEATGVALLPPDVARVIGLASDEVRLGGDVGSGAGGQGLAVNLAGDFLEWTGKLLDEEPCVGAFRVREAYLKRKDVEEAVGRAFAWLNAKVKYRESREMSVEYHTWWFHGAIASEDRWETRFSFSLNAETGVELDLPDPLSLWELEPAGQAASQAEAPPATAPRALGIARRRLWTVAEPFIARMDDRLARDRKRLNDYYRALVRESEKKKGRAGAPPDPEKIESTKRAVDLELRRKLGELDERYAMEATLRPVALIRTRVPVLAADLSVFRKQAHRVHRVYWNPLIKHFEPLACSRCGVGTFTVAFENESVAPLCGICFQK
ncbi:MAG: hypothetical protein DCC68_09405 [Planctomycetota bacterium]|nr:MAG: hypothetical protein DCC68_09405 [Planctomycetota bacterium]